jgi:nitroreductase
MRAAPCDQASLATSIASLRAVRRYKPDPIDQTRLAAWLEAARWCGSGKNSQPWRFISVRSRATLTRLSRLGEYTSHLDDCAVAIVVASLHSEPEFSRCFDLGRICQSIMLLAAADGVGSCPAVFEPLENRLEAATLLGVPAEVELDLAIALGVHDQTGRSEPPGPSPKGRHPVAVLLSEERYHDNARDAVR